MLQPVQLFSKHPLTSRALALLVVPGLLLGVFGYQHYLASALPQTSGSRAVAGLLGPVEIGRDESGIVHIRAEHDNDVHFAMGYAHAQDRLWQLEVQRKSSQGRLGELFGRDYIQHDIWIRTLGIRASARAAVGHLSDDALASLDSYAAGINAWLAEGQQLPVEFSLLGVRPDPWTREDSLAWVKMFALNLAGNLPAELKNHVAAQYLNKEQLDFLFPNAGPHESRQAAIPSPGADFDRTASTMTGLILLQDRLETLSGLGGQFVGSNAWVVSGRMTGGGAILANDPHLSLQIPSMWYAVTQMGESISVSGMSLVGIPLVVFGRNDHIAWGGTSMLADVQDIYIEQPNPADPRLYRAGQQWREFEVRNEVIEVRADLLSALGNEMAPVKIQVRKSRHGPIISDAIDSQSEPMALRWVGLDEDDTTYESFLRISRATDWESFRASMAFHLAPALNMLYADRNGNIGFVGAGRVPIRGTGTGVRPVDGSDKRSEWQGYIPFGQMPQVFNPESGFWINANNRNSDDGYPHMISRDWALSSRHDRIEQMLTELVARNGRLTIDDMKDIQADQKDLSVLRLLTKLRAVSGETPERRQAIAHLGDWSANADADSVGATIFYGWLRTLRTRLFKDELEGFWNKPGPRDLLSTVVSGVSADTVARALVEHGKWCDDVTTPKIEDCNLILQGSLQDTLDELHKLLGGDMRDWQWGRAQSTLYAHVPFTGQKGLEKLFDRRVGNGGAPNTINVASGPYDESDGYVQAFGAGFRQVIMLQHAGDEHWFMNSTGQSGQLASRNYDDMVGPFQRVEYLSLDREITKRSRIELRPQPAAAR